MPGKQLLTLIKKSTVYVASKPKRWYQGQVNILVYCVPGKRKWWWILHVSNRKKAHLSISILEIFFGDNWARIISLFFNFKSFMLSITVWFLYTQKVITITSLVVTYHHTVDPLHHLSTSSVLAPLASCNHQLFTVSMRALFICFTLFAHLLFFFLVSSCEWSHMAFVFLHLTYFIQHYIVKVHPCCHKCQNWILFYGWVLYIYISHIFSIHSVIDWHLGCFHILANINNATKKISVPISFWITVFLYFG